ncbi:winged helix-turn-helix domain-containing protein [Pseudomonas sp. PCH199]|uniref:winged helix-turn-helix domain-containing protein n=1 Tax=unclassified Pseudomonas TaxID=196821 RepID=UPI000BCFACA0|nr:MULTISPECIES: winged helix-turn-helix domain-containing protein [unclassified Pseudomonas]MCW8277097.1 winged helix-turn-helix domain-containing protein [Pseudomonas sp. PCH199]PAM82594.1 DNA-binding protein [Pseudomonas sp. ERMR1:02]
MDSATDQTPVKSFVFDHWQLQSDGTLMRDGQGVHVPPKELNVLRLLLKSAGTVVNKDHLLDLVWPEMDAAEESLTRCIYALRKLLKDNKDFIATVYGQGYRFTCPVVELDEPGQAQASAPSLAVLPFRNLDQSAALDLQDVMIRQLTTAFGGALHVIPSGLMASCKQPVDVQSLVGQLSVDYCLSGRLTDTSAQHQWSIELIRGSDHALLHGQTLDARDLGEALGALTCVVAQRVPRLRPVGDSCGSYPAAVAYLNGLCSVHQHTPQSLRDALVQFRQCLKQDAGYAPAWCGLADAWLGQAMIGLCYQGRAIEEAQAAITNALMLDPSSSLALTRLALLTSLRGCEQAAQVLFKRCLLTADQADVHYFHAWHHWFWRRNEQAAQSIDNCLVHDPDCVRAQVLRVRIALAQSPAETLLMARRSLQQDGARSPLLVILHAVVLAYFGQYAAAWYELDLAGLVESAVGEQGLAAWNVLFGANPLTARNQYANWLRLVEPSAIGVTASPLQGGSVVAPLWQSLQRATDVRYQAPTLDFPSHKRPALDEGRRLA